ncbi:hypothetical protein BC629DRAFT_72836 [Irpex lacteus]|nr:hypothetical protein BC629DRAFT_72836 [Irpex lacteus]
MSQIMQDDGTELRSRWPGNIALTGMPAQTVVPGVPALLEDLDTWAYIGSPNGPGKGRQLFYRLPVPNPQNTAPIPVTIRLYGYVKDHCLTPLGDWRGREDKIASAARWLELGDGGYSEVFAAQMAAVDRIRRYVAYCVRAKTAIVPLRTLRVQQRLFTKVRDGEYPATTLQVGDDPEGLARKVQDTWVVTCSIEMSKRTADGTFALASGLSFNVGDFVEVEAAVEVIVYRRGLTSTPKTVDTRLRVMRVTRLTAAVL